MLVKPLSARFLCFQVDGKKGVGTNIVVSAGMASKGKEVMLGAGRGCMMKQGVKLKQIRALMMYRSWLLVMNRCSCCLLCLVMEALCLTIACLSMIEKCPRRG